MEEGDWVLKGACILIALIFQKEEAIRIGEQGWIGERLPEFKSSDSHTAQIKKMMRD
jgi:hypothetical protein